MGNIQIQNKHREKLQSYNLNTVRKKILVVDDAPFMRTMMRAILQSEGYDVIEAGDGNQCLAEYVIHTPDIILLDIVMPKMDGIVTLQSILSYHPSAKVIMITSVDNSKMIKLAFKEGALSYVIKPFQGPHLMEEIKRILNYSGSLDSKQYLKY